LQTLAAVELLNVVKSGGGLVCSGSALVTINVVNLHRARLALGWDGFEPRSHPLGFNQPTQPGHPSGVGKMSSGVKTGNFSGIE